jgi:Clathrin-H-link/Clathrin, heavy-chain linker
MESDKWIVCVEQTQFSLVDLQNGAQVKRLPLRVEAALMNPVTSVLAMRSGVTLQVFNLDTKAKVKSHTTHKPLVFWKWTSVANLALVTATAVYHWSMEDANPPVKVFDRHQTLRRGCQIINFKVSADNTPRRLCIMLGWVTQDNLFVTCAQASTGAIFGIILRKGQVYRLQLNGQALISYIKSTLRDNDLAIKVAERLGLPGTENFYMAEFERLIQTGDVERAARLVVSSGGVLRTPCTIARFQQIPAQPGQPQPVLVYFSLLLESGKLNEQEIIEFAKLKEKWLKDDKLQCSEMLGDLIMPMDAAVALSVYLRA